MDGYPFRESSESKNEVGVAFAAENDVVQESLLTIPFSIVSYLEAYNEAAALASNDQQKKNTNIDAEMVENYNKAKRSKSLVEKHQEIARSRSKKKSKQDQSEQEWEGQHPWKPWDREKDLTAGRLNVKLDAENMSQGLSSRFSSGSFQRNFL